MQWKSEGWTRYNTDAEPYSLDEVEFNRIARDDARCNRRSNDEQLTQDRYKGGLRIAAAVSTSLSACKPDINGERR